ncbi:MAG: hypothetical protein LRY55_10230 [Leadbetterella sp.]|nr:hypothetical protein [Leadbetterella sp.]
MRFLLFSFLLSPALVFSQWNYKSRYTQGYYAEFGGLSRGASFNYNRILYEGPRGFLSSSIGLAYIYGYSTITGQPNPGGFQNAGLGIPVSATYNYSLGNLDQRLRSRMSRKCIVRPPRYHFDWFVEGGGGIVPSFFNKASLERNRLVYFGTLGLRSQLKISRPYKNNDLVLFLRGGISPFYDKKNFHFTQLGSVYGSLGFGI